MNKRLAAVLTLATFIVVLVNLVFFTVNSFFYDIEYVPKGEFLFSSMSPSGVYTVKMFLVDGGQTLGKGIRGEVVDTESGAVRNVYWVAGEDSAFVGWIDDNIISINDHRIDVSKYNFDWRRETAPGVFKF